MCFISPVQLKKKKKIKSNSFSLLAYLSRDFMASMTSSFSHHATLEKQNQFSNTFTGIMQLSIWPLRNGFKPNCLLRAITIKSCHLCPLAQAKSLVTTFWHSILKDQVCFTFLTMPHKILFRKCAVCLLCYRLPLSLHISYKITCFWLLKNKHVY